MLFFIQFEDPDVETSYGGPRGGLPPHFFVDRPPLHELTSHTCGDQCAVSNPKRLNNTSGQPEYGYAFVMVQHASGRYPSKSVGHGELLPPVLAISRDLQHNDIP